MKIMKWLRSWWTPAELPGRNPTPDHIRKPPPPGPELHVQPSNHVGYYFGPLPDDLDLSPEEMARLQKYIDERLAKLAEKQP